MKKSVLNKKAKKHFAKGLLKSKLGMTYVELLTALGLLALIITSFTPMLLSSYETLYDAGVKVQEVYNSKEEMEEGLARRDSEKSVAIKLDMLVNTSVLFDNISAGGRKIISTFEEGLETIFGQIKPRIEIISPSTVYDDATSHDVTLQTFGLEYKKIKFGAFIPGSSTLDPDEIHIQVIMPNKTVAKESGTADEDMSATNDALVYNVSTGPFCNVHYYETKIQNNEIVYTPTEVSADGLEVSNNDNAGRIKLKISHPDLDFTYSPVKVNVFYINDRGELRTVSDYLYIDPATIIMAGETASNIDYYTSAGVQAINVSADDTVQRIKYQINVEPRKMRTSNSVYLKDAGQFDSAVGAPSKVVEGQTNTEIRSIRWIDNDETHGLNPYYVMTGTNGSIYRMYSFTSDKSDIYNYAIGKKIDNTSTGFFNGTKEYIDRVYTTLDGRRVYPALWGGDFSHIFEFSSGGKRVTYGPSENHKDSDQCWLTSATYNNVEKAGRTGNTAFDVMSANAKFCYYYNGEGTDHAYPSKNTRALSYILTEYGWPLRLTHVLGPVDKIDLFNATELHRGLSGFWDGPNIGSYIRTTSPFTNSAEVLSFHYKFKNDDMQEDYIFAALRLKSLASYALSSSMFNKDADYLNSSADSKDIDEMSKISNVRKYLKEGSNDVTNGNANDINITDAIYIPSTDTTQGSTFYVGNVHGYANIIQTDKISGTEALHNNVRDDTIEENNMVGKWYRNTSLIVGGRWANNDIGTGNGCSYPKGAITDYLIMSNHDGTATYIAKFNDKDFSRMSADDRKSQFDSRISYIKNNDEKIATVPEGHTPGTWASAQGLNNFESVKSRSEFILPLQANTWQCMYFGDVSFTFGFTSNRERVYTNITYDGVTEYTRSYERLYWRSHYGQDSYYYNENTSKDGSKMKYDLQECNQSAYSQKLGFHQAQRATSNGEGALGDVTHLNKDSNDYYNVWFPGEMYNLTKVASKDGVTVAVGYAVAGSSYQYVHRDDKTATSTALGSVYNDGVLAAMVEGKDDAFVNLLYYKDNESFDNYSLYTTNEDFKDESLMKEEYSVFGSYGMHGRDSVQFTAVDLLVEDIKAQNSNDHTVNYYAYYGDNKGRLFRSLVASATDSASQGGTESDALGMDASLVPYIKDTITTVESRSVSPSEMIQITIGGKGLDQYFKNIGTIDITNDMIIVTGEKSDNVPYEYIVVGVKVEIAQNVWEWQWRAIRNGQFKDIITDATIVGGYYYIVGDGWVAGVSLETLQKLATKTLVANEEAVIASAEGEWYSYNPDELIYRYTDTSLYAIAGRDTQ